jgi:hypothetical protein
MMLTLDVHATVDDLTRSAQDTWQSLQQAVQCHFYGQQHGVNGIERMRLSGIVETGEACTSEHSFGVSPPSGIFSDLGDDDASAVIMALHGPVIVDDAEGRQYATQRLKPSTCVLAPVLI